MPLQQCGNLLPKPELEVAGAQFSSTLELRPLHRQEQLR